MLSANNKADHFHMVLPSNASHDFFPENTNATYRIKLSQRLTLEPNVWEAGLKEIFYPGQIETLKKGEFYIKSGSRRWGFAMKEESYPSVHQLVAHINRAISGLNLLDEFVTIGNSISTMLDVLQLSVDQSLDRVKLEIKKSNFECCMSKELADLLGFQSQILGETTEWFQIGIHIAQKSYDLRQGFTAMYVYLDIIKPRSVGDTDVPLLRVVPSEIGNKPMHTGFQYIDYVPVIGTDTDTVEIYIRKDTGDMVPFVKGKSILNVHFRKIRK